MMQSAKFSRKRNVRIALLKGLARSLVQKEKIMTTHTKAKEVSRLAQILVTKAKKNNARELYAFLGPRLAQKFIRDIAPKFAARKGGYTRVTKLGMQKKNSIPMAVVEFV